MKFFKYLESQYPGSDWMEAEKKYCKEDGQLDEAMIIEIWLAEDESGEEGFLYPEAGEDRGQR
jgi:hypothetical protein